MFSILGTVLEFVEFPRYPLQLITVITGITIVFITLIHRKAAGLFRANGADLGSQKFQNRGGVKAKMWRKILSKLCILFLVCATSMNGYSQADNLYAEASAQTTNHWQQLVSVCGTSYFSKNFTQGSKRERRFTGYTEWKALAWRLDPQPVSAAERLNGIQWKGVSFMSVSAYRIADGSDGNWSDWVPGFNHSPEIRLTKVNGQWHVDAPYNVLIGIVNEAPSCQEITAHNQAQSKAAPARRSAVRQLDLNRQLIEEIKGKNDLAKIRQLLQAGSDPNWREYVNSDTALIFALYAPHAVETVRLLFASGADPNIKNYFGDPALLYAVGRNNPALVQAFIDKGVNPNVAKNKIYPLLNVAGCSLVEQCTAAPEIIRLLIKAGADISVTDINGRTALDIAEEKLRDDQKDPQLTRLHQQIINALDGRPVIR